MAQHRTRAAFMRGGTSKAIVFRQFDLPADRAEWDAIFLAAMGSPDPNGRQLDGMGGGVSSLSKVCIVGPSTRADADLDYIVGQVLVRDRRVDYSANCGNMSAAIAPFAIEEGLIPVSPGDAAAIRMHNASTGKIVVSRFPLERGLLKDEGDMVIDGVSGRAAPIRLEFEWPGGAVTTGLLPTGQALDRLEVDGMGEVEVSLVDAATPCVFVAAAALGKAATELPAELEGDAAFMAQMEAIRCAAAVAMGMAADLAEAHGNQRLPKFGILAAPSQAPTLSGILDAGDMDILVRMISVGQLHRAVPLTGAICLAVAARVPGTLANRLARPGDGPIHIAHPSGVIVVDAAIEPDAAAPGGVVARHGAVYRTARRLFEGNVLWRDGET